VAAIRALRPDLELVPLRGNVPTRLGRVQRAELDAAVLALAGLRRLGLDAEALPLDPTQVVPAPGQGALALETRGGADAAAAAVAVLDDPDVRVAVEAERAAMAVLEGGCRVPLGAICLAEGAGRSLLVRVSSPDGRRVLGTRVAVDPRAPRASGERAARELLAQGAAELIQEVSRR
jgi:hydroxymethylbilane synthase